MTQKKFFLVTIAFLMIPFPCFAFLNPIRDPDKLVHAKQEKCVVVKGARVILADYSLVRRDFPAIEKMLDSEIDTWLLQFACVAKSQVSQGEHAKVNSKIDVERASEKDAFRPYDYGRALVLKTDDGGLIDVKGAGARGPRPGAHSNGLFTLSGALEEFSIEKLVHQVFVNSKSGFETVESYAVLDLGINVNVA